MAQRPVKIAVIRFGAMGDILFTTPALRGLKALHPDAHLTYITLRKWRFVLRRNAHVDRVCGLSHRGPQALGRLWRERFDLIVNLQETEDAAQLAEHLNADERRGHRWVDGQLRPGPESADYMRDGKGFHRMLAAGRTLAETHCDIAGVVVPDRRYDFDPGPVAAWRARRFLKRVPAGRAGSLIALHTHSRGSPDKHWGADSVRRVVTAFPECTFVLLGYGPDRPAVRELESLENVVASYQHIAVQAQVIRRCRLFLGIDSGPRQIALAVGTPAVVLFGPTPPEFLETLPADRSLQIARDCSPCFEHTCRDGLDCMGLIDPERIVEVFGQALKDTGAHPDDNCRAKASR